jgi:hypothetical protein
MRILFVAPGASLNTGSELARIASGNTMEIVDGAVDRAGLNRALRVAQYDVIHFAGHGDKGVIQLADGLLDDADLASMAQAQTSLLFCVINSCNSLSIATTIHNRLHVPVIAHDAEITDQVAIRSAEVFYRAYEQLGNVGDAFDRMIKMMGRLYPGQATVPILINGDMASQRQLNECMTYVRTELGEMRETLTRVEADVRELRDSDHPQRVTMMLVLLVLLIVAQLMTPWLNAIFAH